MDGRRRLARHDEVPVIRHSKVQGKRSPLNPDDREYWELRRLRRLAETLRAPKRLALLERQGCRCAMCDVGFDPDEDLSLIDAHHTAPPGRNRPAGQPATGTPMVPPCVPRAGRVPGGRGLSRMTSNRHVRF